MNLLLGLLFLGQSFDPAFAGLETVADPSETVVIQVTEAGYAKVRDRFNGLKVMEEKDWAKIPGTWMQSAIWPEPDHFKSGTMGANPEDIVVESSPLKVETRFYGHIDGVKWDRSTSLAHWACVEGNTECGWIPHDGSNLMTHKACRHDPKVGDLICHYVVDPKDPVQKTSPRSLGESFVLYVKRTPGMKLISGTIKAGSER